MALKKNNAEGGTNAVQTSTGNSGGASGTAWDLVNVNAGSTFLYTTTSPIHGSMSYSNASTTTSATPLVDWADTAAASAVARFYFRFTTLPDALLQLGINFRGNAGASTLARTEFNITTGAVRSVMGATTSSFMGTAPSASTVYRLEAACTGFNGASGAMTTNLYLGDSLTPTATASLTGATTSFTCDHVRFGKFAGGGNFDWVLDSLAANIGASAEIGPESSLSPGWTSGFAVKIG